LSSTELLFEIVGWIGAAALLLAYGLASSGRLPATGRAFQHLNLAGSAALAANSGFHGAWPSAALNLVWMAIAVATLARRILASRTGKA
jgi:hypothetical protein